MASAWAPACGRGPVTRTVGSLVGATCTSGYARAGPIELLGARRTQRRVHPHAPTPRPFFRMDHFASFRRRPR